MRVGYSLYKNQGIHTIVSIFTVEKGTIKVLLIRRTNEPFKGMWGLVGGALYNNETLDECVKREIFEKTGLTDVKVYQSSIFDRIDRSPSMRMIAISYVGIVDSSKVHVLKKTLKTDNADWVPIDRVRELAYDHNEILKSATETLKKLIVSSDILKNLFPRGCACPGSDI